MTLQAANDYPFTADQPARLLMLEAVRRRQGESFGSGPDGLRDNWQMLLECAAEATGRDTLLPVERRSSAYDAVASATAQRSFVDWGLGQIKVTDAQPGDLILFEMGGGVHAAVLTSTDGPEWKVMHKPYARACCESWAEWWMQRAVSAWTFDRPASGGAFYDLCREIASCAVVAPMGRIAA